MIPRETPAYYKPVLYNIIGGMFLGRKGGVVYLRRKFTDLFYIASWEAYVVSTNFVKQEG